MRNVAFSALLVVAAVSTGCSKGPVEISGSTLFKAVDENDLASFQSALKDVPELARAESENGIPVLHHAAGLGRLDMVKLLLDGGVDVNSTGSFGDVKAVQWIFQCKGPRLDILALLLENGADPNTADGFGSTVLMSAARLGRTDLVELLVSKGADVNARETGSLELSVLHYAALGANPDVVECLIGHGADTAAKDKHGRTPLDFALAVVTARGAAHDTDITMNVDAFVDRAALEDAAASGRNFKPVIELLRSHTSAP